MEDVRSARGVEHVRPIEKTRERLAILAVANEAEAAGWGDVACDAAHAAAPAPKRKVQRHIELTSRGRRSIRFGPDQAGAARIAYAAGFREGMTAGNGRMLSTSVFVISLPPAVP